MIINEVNRLEGFGVKLPPFADGGSFLFFYMYIYSFNQSLGKGGAGAARGRRGSSNSSQDLDRQLQQTNFRPFKLNCWFPGHQPQKSQPDITKKQGRISSNNILFVVPPPPTPCKNHTCNGVVWKIKQTIGNRHIMPSSMNRGEKNSMK